MGFNTVAMFLNDHFGSIEQAPKSVLYGICHPPMSERELKERSWYNEMGIYARSKGEGYPGFGNGINILPTFHADDVHFLYAGKNTLERLEFLQYGKARIPFKKMSLPPKEVNTVTLILPDWWSQ